MEKLPMETIRDLEEPELLEENDRTAEDYNLSMLAASQPGRLHNIYDEASRALRAASPISREEFFKKWG